MSDTEEIPFLAPIDYAWSEPVRLPGHEGFRLLYFTDGRVLFEHRCDRGPRGTVICAPALRIGDGHTLTRNATQTHAHPHGEPTVRASVLCPDCSLHGFITDGWWRAS